MEIIFHPIEKTARFAADLFVGVEGATFKSPLKTIVKPVSQAIQDLGLQVIENKQILGVLLVVVALAILVFALSRMVVIMRGAIAKKLEVIVDKYLFTNTARAFVIGLLVTCIVQSSSVTTSLVIPLLGTGIVTIEAAFPYMVGANIGTTITAFMAAMVKGEASGVTIALAHLTFNLFGTIVFLTFRSVPIRLACPRGPRPTPRRYFFESGPGTCLRGA